MYKGDHRFIRVGLSIVRASMWAFTIIVCVVLILLFVIVTVERSGEDTGTLFRSRLRIVDDVIRKVSSKRPLKRLIIRDSGTDKAYAVDKATIYLPLSSSTVSNEKLERMTLHELAHLQCSQVDVCQGYESHSEEFKRELDDITRAYVGV